MMGVRSVVGNGLGLVVLWGTVVCAASPVGEPLAGFDFEGPAAGEPWQGLAEPNARLTSGWQNSQSLAIERPSSQARGSVMVQTPLSLDQLRGTRVRVEAMIKAEGVAKPPQAWNGVKCMLHTVAPSGSQWQQRNSVYGTFDWKPVSFIAEVPPDATKAVLMLGLEQTTGKAWFDDIKLTVIGRRRSTPETAPTGEVYKGHKVPRLRGAMVSPRVTAEDLRVLGGQWKANHIRYQLTWGGFPRSPADKGDLAAYDAWLESMLAHLDELLPVCRELGIAVLIDLHTPPGGRNDANECRMFHEKRFQDAFLAVWDNIARRYRGEQTVWGYDLVNEPVEGVVGEGLLDWRSLAHRTAEAVRRLDPDHAIVIEPAPWGSPQSLEWFEPLPVEGLVYSVHMYQPHSFTHQGVYEAPTGISYPGEIEGRHYDRAALKRVLQPVIDFQRDYGVHIYIGEFSAIRWAPGSSAENYLRDCIELFEEQGWDWAYHAFREWDGWSVEHGSDRNDRRRASEPTGREKLLRSWYGRNEPAR